MVTQKKRLIISNLDWKIKNLHSGVGTGLFRMWKKVEEIMWRYKKIQLSCAYIQIGVDQVVKLKTLKSGPMPKINKREFQQLP